MRALPAIVILLLGVVAWYVLRDPGPAVHAPPVASAADAPIEADAALPEPAVAPPPKIEAQRTDLDAAPKKKSSLLGRLFGKKEPAPEVEEPAKIGVDCTVIVVDARGGEHATESGQVTATFSSAPSEHEEEPTRSYWFAMEEVKVTEGRFHVEVLPERRLDVRALVLGGRPAVVEGGPFEVVAGVPLTMRARWIEAASLRVIDAASRVPLADVTVARSDRSFSRYGQVHPGPIEADEIVVEHAVSPVSLPPSRAEYRSPGETGVAWIEHCWVVAPGHAWTSVSVDFKQVGETVVELAPGAELVVHVQGELPTPAPAAVSLEDAARKLFSGGDPTPRFMDGDEDEDREPKLRLRRVVERKDFEELKKEALAGYDEAKASDFPGGRKPSLAEFEQMIEGYRTQFEAQFEHGPLLAEFDATLGETTIAGLPVGPLSVSVELGDSYRAPFVAGAAVSTLVAETSNRVALTLAPRAPPPASVPLSGTLHVPRSWDRDDLVLQVEPITLRGATSDDDVRLRARDMTAIAGRPDWYRWSAGTLQPATYRVAIGEAGFSRQVELAAPGVTDLEIVLLEAATLSVRLVEDVTGTPVEFEEAMWGIAWYPERADGIFDFESMIRLEQQHDATFLAKVPVGRGSIFMSELAWNAAGETTCDVRPGSNELVVRLRRACVLTVTVACDGTPVSMDSVPQDMNVEAVGHTGHVTKSTWSGERYSMQVSAPGRYRITLADRAGYEHVEPIELEIQDGEHVTRVIELEKKR